MKSTFLRISRYQVAARGLLFGFLLLCWGPASAQNLVKNPGFESPIGTNATGNARGGANFPLGTTTGGEACDPAWKATWNWMIAYPWGGPDDFELKDRCTTVRGGSGNYWSARLRPGHNKWAHAYYTQTITNLQAGHSYTVSGWMKEDRWKSVTDPLRDQLLIYLEAIGGQGDPTPDGRARVLAVATVQSNLDAPYTYPNTTWLQFTNRQTPDASGQIELRLHLQKPGWCLADKLELMSAYFDDISLTP